MIMLPKMQLTQWVRNGQCWIHCLIQNILIEVLYLCFTAPVSFHVCPFTKTHSICSCRLTEQLTHNKGLKDEEEHSILSCLTVIYSVCTCRLIEQLTHNKGLKDEEVKRLKGQLALVEKEYKAAERR